MLVDAHVPIVWQVGTDPQLTRPALLAALGFAAKALGSEIVYPMAADSRAAGR